MPYRVCRRINGDEYDEHERMSDSERQEAIEVLALLIPYGMIHTVTGVKYPEGTHEEAIRRGERLLNRLRRRE
jgi:hypothetical protein